MLESQRPKVGMPGHVHASCPLVTLQQRRRPVIAMAFAAALLAACAGPQPERKPEPPTGTECRAATAGDSLVGNWLSVRRQAGVTGELRTLFVFNADGTMRYGEQLARPRKAPQGLDETGCWHREGKTVVLRTVESNGSPVDLQDPIYVNRYQVTREGGDRIQLRAPDGAQLDAKRMPPDYRLPL